VLDGNLNTLTGNVTAAAIIIIIITAWETQAELAICLGETLASSHDVAVRVARPGDNRREVGNTLDTPLVMRFIDGFIHGQTAEIKTDHGLEAGIACHDVCEGALGCFLFISDGDGADGEHRSIDTMVQSKEKSQTVGYLRREFPR